MSEYDTLDTPMRVVAQKLPRVSGVMGPPDDRPPVMLDPRMLRINLDLEELGAYVWLAQEQAAQRPVGAWVLADRMTELTLMRTGEKHPQGHRAMHIVNSLVNYGLLAREPDQHERLRALAELNQELVGLFADEQPAPRTPKRQAVAPPPPPVPTSPTEPDGSWTGPPPKGQAIVYVLFGSAGRAVYVGSTDNFGARMKAHQAGGKRWTTWSAVPCTDRDEAFEVEAEYLSEYMPHLNVQGPQRRAGGAS